MKVYNFKISTIYFIGLIVLAILVIITFMEYIIHGLSREMISIITIDFLIVLGFTLVILGFKNRRIILDDNHIKLESSNYLVKKLRIEIPFNEIESIITTRDFMMDGIRIISNKGREIRITYFIENYIELIKEICKRARNVQINYETKRLVEKGSRVLGSSKYFLFQKTVNKIIIIILLSFLIFGLIFVIPKYSQVILQYLSYKILILVQLVIIVIIAFLLIPILRK